MFGTDNRQENQGYGCCGDLFDCLFHRDVITKFSKTGISKTDGVEKSRLDSLFRIKKLLFDAVVKADINYVWVTQEKLLTIRLRNSKSRVNTKFKRKSAAKNRPKNLKYKKKRVRLRSLEKKNISKKSPKRLMMTIMSMSKISYTGIKFTSKFNDSNSCIEVFIV